MEDWLGQGDLRQELRQNTWKIGSPLSPNTNNASSTPYISDFIGFQVKPWYEDRSFLHHKYIVEQLSSKQIAEEILSSKSTVLSHLKQFNIPLRSQEYGHSINPGQVAFGERLIRGKLIVHKGEQDVIKKIVQLRIQGLSYQKIAELLNLWEVPTKNRNSKWHPTTVMKIEKRKKGESF